MLVFVPVQERGFPSLVVLLPVKPFLEEVVKYADLVSEPVPQTEPLDTRQVQNNAGGFVYQLDDWARLERFLILGSDEPTYYQSAKTLTRENAAVVERCFAANAERTVMQIAEISDQGRAAKNDAAVFALALGAVSSDVGVRQKALAALPVVCRTSTHLFQFVALTQALGRGWGRALKRAVANWYDSKLVDKLAYQVIKYRAREGYTHKRLLQTAHPKGDGTLTRDALYRWVCGKSLFPNDLPVQIRAHEEAMRLAPGEARLLELAVAHDLPWEALPTEALKNPDVWSAMLPGMGLTALIRNLGGMTQYGTLRPLSRATALVVDRLSNEEELRKARIHPFNVLVASAAYRNGASVRGSRSWEPVGTISDALEGAFYSSFKHVAPTGKRILIGLDVSGSMSSPLMGSPLSVCEGAAAMAMTTMRTEKNWHVFAFDDGFRDLQLSSKDSLESVLLKTRNINGGGTDCALPMIYAAEHGLEVDTFAVYTDNETYAGRLHPKTALLKYRRKTGIPAKLVVVGMTSMGFSIADPSDGGMMDFVGFDSAAPAVMADFIRS